MKKRKMPRQIKTARALAREAVPMSMIQGRKIPMKKRQILEKIMKKEAYA